MKTQQINAEQRLAELSRKYGVKHPAMVLARQEVENLEKRKAAEIRRIVLSVKSELELAAAREKDLRRRLSSGRGDAVAANEKLVRYEELKRAVETNRQFYETLMARAKEESLTQKLQGVQVYTLEPAVVPAAPDGPRTARTVLLGLALGLVGAVGMALFVEYLDNTVRTAEDLELKTGVPVLGVIPPAPSRGERHRHGDAEGAPSAGGRELPRAAHLDHPLLGGGPAEEPARDEHGPRGGQDGDGGQYRREPRTVRLFGAPGRRGHAQAEEST